jgi:hypothetical protein
MRPSRLCRSAIILLTCTALSLPGCSTQSQRIGFDDGSDVCRPQRVALDSTGNYFGEDIVAGAAIGAVAGGLMGALAGGNARSALIGAAAGGALGAAGGYWKARMQQASDQQTLYRTVYSDIERDNVGIDKTQLAFNQLVDCRQAEASRIRADLRSGLVSRPLAEGAMAGVRQRADGDSRIALAISGKIQERSANFAFANNQVNPGAPPYIPPEEAPQPQRRGRVATRAPAPPPATPAGQVQVATSTNLAKRDQLARSISTAQASTSSFELL